MALKGPYRKAQGNALGMTHADGEQYAEAERYLVRSIASSGPGESHLRKAYALLMHARTQLKRLDEAHATCRSGLGLFPDDAELRFREGILLHELGRRAEAERAYLDVLENDEQRHFTSIDRAIKGFKTRQNLAVLYTETGDFAGAERQWRQVVREAPGYRLGWRGFVGVLLRRSRVDEARGVAEELIRGGTLRTEGLLLRGRVAAAEGDTAGERADLEDALRESPADLETWRSLCQALFEHGTPDEAERALQGLVRLQPEDASAFHNLGTLYLRSRRYREAAQACRESLRLRPDSAPTYLHLGYALKGDERLDEAEAAFGEVLRLDPDNAAAREELARAGQPASRPVLSAPLVRT